MAIDVKKDTGLYWGVSGNYDAPQKLEAYVTAKEEEI
jgi:hypothetical protein